MVLYMTPKLPSKLRTDILGNLWKNTFIHVHHVYFQAVERLGKI